MKVEYNAKARLELIEAAEYDALQREGLGGEFLVDVEVAVAAIASRPEAFESVRKDIRRYLLDRFPYAVYYRLPEPGTVRIIVVRHHARHPGFGMRRR